MMNHDVVVWGKAFSCSDILFGSIPILIRIYFFGQNFWQKSLAMPRAKNMLCHAARDTSSSLYYYGQNHGLVLPSSAVDTHAHPAELDYLPIIIIRHYYFRRKETEKREILKSIFFQRHDAAAAAAGSAAAIPVRPNPRGEILLLLLRLIVCQSSSIDLRAEMHLRRTEWKLEIKLEGSVLGGGGNDDDDDENNFVRATPIHEQ